LREVALHSGHGLDAQEQLIFRQKTMAPKSKTKGKNRRAARLGMATTGRSPTVKTLKLPARVTKKSRRNSATRKLAEAALKRSKELLEKRVRERTRELRLANKELENEIKRRKGLEGEILEITDREQQRLGQELHDGICQHLTAVAFMARSVALRLKNHRVIEVSDIEKIAELVNTAAADTRNLSRALHRVDIDAARLADALQDLVDREIWRTPCRLEIRQPVHLNDDIAALNLYRIAREAVVNANKHAQAREIVVALGRWRKGIVLSVTDNGVGLHNGLNNAHGLGFHIMNYRARSIGGRLEIESPKQGGTRVACYFPVSAPQSQKKENARLGRVPREIRKGISRRHYDFPASSNPPGSESLKRRLRTVK
jgi:signal transduction histidine kinase